jgi:CRP/FNR family transcriptional regulator, anaerobic regulatory protein
VSKVTRLDVHNSAPDGSLLPVLCRSCDARHRGVCGALNDQELVQLAQASGRRHLEPGETVVCDEDDVLAFANILEGAVKLSKLMSDGRQQIVGLQFAPDFLGRPFDKESHLTAEAATDVSLCTFPKATFERMMREKPELQHRVLRQTLTQLDQAREWMVTLGRKTAREKVASFLLLVARSSNPTEEGEPRRFELPLARGDMADFLGLTIETVSRQMTALRRDEVIDMEGTRRIVVRSLRRLAREAGI